MRTCTSATSSLSRNSESNHASAGSVAVGDGSFAAGINATAQGFRASAYDDNATAVGANALAANQTGSQNTAVGSNALATAAASVLLAALVAGAMAGLWRSFGRQAWLAAGGWAVALGGLLGGNVAGTARYEYESDGGRACFHGGFGIFPAKHLMLLAMAHALRLGKYGA